MKRHLASISCFIVSLTFTCFAAPAISAPGDPVGDVVQANQFLDRDQSRVDLALSADGFIYMAWDDFSNLSGSGQDGSLSGVFGSLFTPAGTRLGDEFVINTFVLGEQRSVSVAVDAGGNGVYLWQTLGLPADDILALQRFDASGAMVGDELSLTSLVDVAVNAGQAAAMDANGDFVIAYESDFSTPNVGQVYILLFDSDGMQQGPPIQVNDGLRWSLAPAVAMDAAGNIAVAWTEDLSASNDLSVVMFRLFDAAGVPLTAPVDISTGLGAAQIEVGAIAMDIYGNAVVIMERTSADLIDTDVYMRRLDANGVPRDAGPVRVNTYTDSLQSNGSVAVDIYGNITVVWDSLGQTGSGRDIYLQRYDADGQPLGGETLVNINTVGRQLFPQVAMDADGDTVVAWKSDGLGTGDDIFFRRYQ